MVPTVRTVPVPEHVCYHGTNTLRCDVRSKIKAAAIKKKKKRIFYKKEEGSGSVKSVVHMIRGMTRSKRSRARRHLLPSIF